MKNDIPIGSTTDLKPSAPVPCICKMLSKNVFRLVKAITCSIIRTIILKYLKYPSISKFNKIVINNMKPLLPFLSLLIFEIINPPVKLIIIEEIIMARKYTPPQA